MVNFSTLPYNNDKARFGEVVRYMLDYACDIGATSAAAIASETTGLSVSVRERNIDTVEQMHDRSFEITVYSGFCQGSASTNDFSKKSLQQTVKAAWHIACYTSQDCAVGLPDKNLLATTTEDLDLYHPWDISAEGAVELALRAERAAIDTDPAINSTEGANVSTCESHFVLGNTHGFLSGYPSSRHILSVSPIARIGSEMQREDWYTANRNPKYLSLPEGVGKYAAERALSRLHARRIHTGKFPVLFEAPVALGLLECFSRAISGRALYQQASFLINAIGNPVFPGHISISEYPHAPGAMGSAPFDAEGVRTQTRQIVTDGVLKSYFLSSYTARKLGMATTGNAGGPHNLTLTSSLTCSSDNLDAMLKKMDTGLLVTELIGQGINYVTGDYSRGVFGYWVKNGEIQHAVQEVTVAGNLLNMFQQIIGIGNDVISRGNKTTGSVLIQEMAVAGSG